MKNIAHVSRFLRAIDIFYFHLIPSKNPIKAHHTAFIYPWITFWREENSQKQNR